MILYGRERGHSMLPAFPLLLGNALKGLFGRSSHCGSLYHHVEDNKKANEQHFYII